MAERNLRTGLDDPDSFRRVLANHDGDWTVHDVLGASLRVTKAVMPALTVKRGEVFTPEWGPRPWGWQPDPGPSGAIGFKSCC